MRAENEEAGGPKVGEVGEVAMDGDNGDFNLVPEGDSSPPGIKKLLAGLCAPLSPLPFLERPAVSILVVKSGEDVLK